MRQCEQCRAEFSGSSNCPQCGSSIPRADELLGREVLGRYQLVRLIAEGGMGRVYLAEQAVGTVTRRVAVKVLRPQLSDDHSLASRFAREAETLVRLTHPNTVQLFDFGALPDGTLALVMEYVEGRSLAKVLAAGPMPLARIDRLLVQLCGALREAHAHGIVHRDLKPENLLIADRLGHGEQLKVLDFGIAKVSTHNDTRNTKLTQQGMIIGTPPYMSPEQFRGDPVDARSDIYSLGIIVFEMLTGRLPFLANTPWEWASKHLTQEPELLNLDAASGLLARHVIAIRKALEKKPDARPQSVDAFLEMFSSSALAESNPEPASLSASITTETEALSARAQRRLPRAVFAVAAIGLLAGAGRLITSSKHNGAGPVQRSTLAPPAPIESGALTVSPPALPVIPTLPIGVSVPADGSTRPPGNVPSPERNSRSERIAAVTSRSLGLVGSDPRTASAELMRDPPLSRLQESSAREHREALPPNLSSHTGQHNSALSADLVQRISKIQDTMNSRTEVAVGLYQAATARYGRVPALQELRAGLTKAGEVRERSLVSAGRCAQAQALHRALRSIEAAPTAADVFKGGCAPP